MANDISTLTDLNGVTHDIKDSTARSAITTHASDTTIHVTAADKTAWNNKVDKETGKGLSTNDFTDALKTKLDGIASGAEVNVQSDWNEADSSADSYIQNKPNLSAVATSGAASDVSYDNTNSGMTATNVQGAVDELNSDLAAHTGDTVIHVTASDKANWNGKQDALTFDSTPTTGSSNPVTSTGIKTAVDGLQDEIDDLTTSISVEETEPYSFRESYREDVIGNTMNVRKIVGGTVAWNQSARELTSTYWRTTNSTATYGNGVVTFTASARYGGVLPLANEYRPSIILNHKYLFAGAFKTAVADADVTFGLTVGNTVYLGKNGVSTTNWVSIATIQSASETRLAQITLQDNSASGWGEVQGKNIMFIDLTQMFGSTIADYIYSLEQATAGTGVAFFRNLFPNDYYAYNAGELISVKTSAHVMRDANNNIIGNYALDADLELRGLPKIANGKLYYDGDEYESSGNVQRRYGVVDLGTLSGVYNSTTKRWAIYIPYVKNVSGQKLTVFISDKWIAKASARAGDEGVAFLYNEYLYCYTIDGTNSPTGYLVYELATPTTETADPFEQYQTFDVDGTEEYVDYAHAQELRDVSIPVGNDTLFPITIFQRVEQLEEDLKEEERKSEETFSKIAGSIATEETSPATATHATGTYLMYQNRLYKVIASIAVGETLTVGTNIQATTIMAELLALTA